jgi:Arc/MetJ-type ribon-helix-helix transcriptional regulator
LGLGSRFAPDQNAFIRQAIDAGRLHRPEEAVREALALWEERERRRAEILAAVDTTRIDTARASLAAGKGRVITEDSMRQLADEVKQRGRARLAAEQQTPPLMVHRVAEDVYLELDDIWLYMPNKAAASRLPTRS